MTTYWAKTEKKEIKGFLESMKMGVQHTPNLWDTMKVVVRRNYIALSGCKKKWARSHTSNLTVHMKALKTEAALFITDRNWKQLRCLSIKE